MTLRMIRKQMSNAGYIAIHKPEHPFCSKWGYVYEHRLVYEDYHKCILLPWSDIHHRNGVKNCNLIDISN